MRQSPKHFLFMSIVNALLIVAIFTFVTKATGLLPLWGELLAHLALGVVTAKIIYDDYKNTY